jgi:hypothetical protein
MKTLRRRHTAGRPAGRNIRPRIAKKFKPKKVIMNKLKTRKSKTMKPVRPIILATVFLLVSTGMIWARIVQIWPYQKLLDMSDLVVIATPISTSDTKEQTGLPGMAAQPVIGVETGFAVSAVLKGDKALKDIVLHHYRFDKIVAANGPDLVSFVLAEKRTYLLFLVREADGRYAPAFGQVDPGTWGISVLGEAPRAKVPAPGE